MKIRKKIKIQKEEKYQLIHQIKYQEKKNNFIFLNI